MYCLIIVTLAVKYFTFIHAWYLFHCFTIYADLSISNYIDTGCRVIYYNASFNLSLQINFNIIKN